MTNNIPAILLQNCSLEDLQKMFDLLQQQLNEIKSKLNEKPVIEYLTRTEVAKLFKCDISTVHHWTKKGKLKAYAKGNRVYYKLSEIVESMTPIN